MSVLFADAEASTELGSQLDAEEVFRLVQDAIGAMVEAVESNRGMVAQFTGDGVMALFGAPVSQENSPRDAVAAALAMQRALEVQADRMRVDGLPSMRFRVGVHTGPVVVGRVSERLDLDYTALGDTANVAARVQASAEPGTVFITDHTYRLVEGFVEAERVGPIRLKGKDQPVVLWRAVAETGVRSRLDAAARRGLTPFVGRTHELSTLEGHLAESLRGRGRAVVLAGEPGAGKSRLLRELHSRTTVRWYEAGCSATGSAVAHLPVTELLKRVFGISEVDDDTAIVQRVADTTSLWSPTGQQSEPLLRVLLSVESGDEEVDRLAPIDRSNRCVDAIRGVVTELGAQEPTVVVIEDLHWIDDRSEDAIGAMIEAIERLPVLLLLTTRPGYAPTVLARGDVHRVVVGPMGRADAEQVAAHVLAADELPPELAVVLDKAEGNPFFLEEATKSLLESGAVSIADGTVRVRSVDESQVPDTVLEVILARIDRLDREARDALQLAAVIGREFTVRLLGRVSGLDASLTGHLAELQALELILERSRFPELSYLFKHALTHDVAYSTLLVERRRALHLLVARATEELYADRLPEHYEMLASHYSEAQQWPEAFAYANKAARKTEDAYASREALVYHRLALTAAEHVPVPIAAVMAVLDSALEDAVMVGDMHAMAELPQRVIRLGEATEDVHLQARALVSRGYMNYVAHRFTDAEIDLRDALALDPSPDVELAAKTHLLSMFGLIGRHADVDALRHDVERLLAGADPTVFGNSMAVAALIDNWRGHFAESADLVRRCRLGDYPANQLTGFAWMEGLSLIGSGRYEEALGLLIDGSAVAERYGDTFYGARMLNTIGWVYSELLDCETSLSWNERSLAMARETPSLDHEIECQACLNVADNLVALGRPREADEHYAFVLGIVQNDVEADLWVKWRYRQHLAASLGALRLADGDPEGALSLARECIEWATDSDSPKNFVKGLRLQGDALSRLGRDAEAADALEAALSRAEHLGNPTQLWRCLSSLGRHRDALDVIDSVASELAVERRDRMLASAEVAALRELCA